MSCKVSLRLSTVSKVVNLNANIDRRLFAKMRGADAAPRVVDLNSAADAEPPVDSAGCLFVGVRIAV